MPLAADDPLDPRPRKRPAHEIGQTLEGVSVEDLEARIALLREEIARLEADLVVKIASRQAADAFFKS